VLGRSENWSGSVQAGQWDEARRHELQRMEAETVPGGEHSMPAASLQAAETASPPGASAASASAAGSPPHFCDAAPASADDTPYASHAAAPADADDPFLLDTMLKQEALRCALSRVARCPYACTACVHGASAPAAART
jgi:hypothetical protein